MVNARMKSGLYALLAGLGLLLGACKSSTDGGGDPVSEAELVGKWNFTSFRYKMASSVSPANPEFPNTSVDTTLQVTGSGSYINLMADGTYESVFPDLTSLIFMKRSAEGEGTIEEGTWSVSGDLLTTVTSEDDSAVFAVVLDGSLGTFTQTVNETFSGGGYTYSDKGSITVKAAKQ
jgi:hypothetical protein